VVFISGNMPMRTEITPLLIMTKLEQYDYAGATSLAVSCCSRPSCSFWPSTGPSDGSAGGVRRRGDACGRGGAREAARGEAAARQERIGPDAAGDGFAGTPTGGRAVRLVLILIAMLFLGLFLFVPLGIVFVQAFDKGLAHYARAVSQPETLAALRLTLIVVALTVPLNLLFGIAAAWSIARFRFPGRSLLLTLIDLPFTTSPWWPGSSSCCCSAPTGGSGPCSRLTGSRSSSPCPASSWPLSSSPSPTSPAS